MHTNPTDIWVFVYLESGCNLKDSLEITLKVKLREEQHRIICETELWGHFTTKATEMQGWSRFTHKDMVINMFGRTREMELLHFQVDI